MYLDAMDMRESRRPKATADDSPRRIPSGIISMLLISNKENTHEMYGDS
jgi:hypothetical protein